MVVIGGWEGNTLTLVCVRTAAMSDGRTRIITVVDSCGSRFVFRMESDGVLYNHLGDPVLGVVGFIPRGDQTSLPAYGRIASGHLCRTVTSAEGVFQINEVAKIETEVGGVTPGFVALRRDPSPESLRDHYSRLGADLLAEDVLTA